MNLLFWVQLLHYPLILYYQSCIEIATGSIIYVMLRGKICLAIVISPALITLMRHPFLPLDLTIKNTKAKEISSITSFVMPDLDLAWVHEMAQYFCLDISDLSSTLMQPLKNTLQWMSKHSEVDVQEDQGSENDDFKDFFQRQLTNDQWVVFLELQRSLKDDRIDVLKAYLLEGVTGSGKTQIMAWLCVYVVRILKQQVLFLVPEVNLLDPVMKRLETCLAKFDKEISRSKKQSQKNNIYCWHGGVLLTQKRNALFYLWFLKKSGILIATRSGIFVPLPHLALIIMDEVHDPSYKQNYNTPYYALTVAKKKAEIYNTLFLAVTATPDMDCLYYVQQGQFRQFILKTRYEQAELPNINIISIADTKYTGKNPIIFHADIIELIQKAMEAKQSVLIFVNRRGYSPLIFCSACGYSPECPHCLLKISYHKHFQSFCCHYCDFVLPLPKICPECTYQQNLEKPLWIPWGIGIERVFSHVKKLFPQCCVELLTSETKDSVKILNDFAEHKIDILLGTQIVAKGHHFSKLQHVILLDFSPPGRISRSYDFRSDETLYALWIQVIGRVGRTKNFPGTAWIQTSNPQSFLMRTLINPTGERFFDVQKSQRQEQKLPPFGTLIAIVVSHEIENLCQKSVINIKKFLQSYFMAHNFDLMILGPSPAPLFHVRGVYRFRLLLQGDVDLSIGHILWPLREEIKRNVDSKTHVLYDVNPYDFA